MARPNKPWYSEKRKRWCVRINGKFHTLGKKKQEAMRKFHELMAAPKKKASADSIAAILDQFLTWCFENRAKPTADRYKDFCQDFLDHCGDICVSDLDTSLVTAWLNDRPTWNSTTKNNAITAVSRAFNWGVKNAGLKFNPIKGMEKPTPQTRTVVITTEEFDQILNCHNEDDPFRELLTVAFDCGSRPFEITGLEARHVELDKCRAVIPAKEAKKGIQRAFYFGTERSMAIIERLVNERPEGPLFVNTAGTPWNGYSISCRFQRLQKKGKVPKLYFMYAMRHSFITHSLVAGVDSHTVAKLAGHQSTSQLDRTYSHIAEDHKFMLDAARKATGASDSGASGEDS